jgi:hypothetical protein
MPATNMTAAMPAQSVRGKDGVVVPVIDLDAHKQVLRRMREEQDANFEERLRLCDPDYAKKLEDLKPIYRWKVEFRIIERRKPEASPKKDRYADDEDLPDDDSGLKIREITKHIAAKDQAEAWALICDKMQEWPSPKVAKPQFTRGKKFD